MSNVLKMILRENMELLQEKKTSVISLIQVNENQSTHLVRCSNIADKTQQNAKYHNEDGKRQKGIQDLHQSHS